MKNRNSIRNIIIIASLLPLITVGCKELGRIDFIDESGDAPPQVTNIEVRNTPGGAVLKYRLPEDKNLLYVLAEYEIQPGVINETKSSYFKDSLVLEGFGKAKEYEVKIYSVGRNGKASDPLIETVYPTTPPVHLVEANIRETFGGFVVDIVNPKEANIAIVLVGDTTNNGYLNEMFTFYNSGRTKSAHPFRDEKFLNTNSYTFGVYIRDRWNNISDTIIIDGLSPWFDEEIVKGNWSPLSLPSIYEHAPLNSGFGLQYMFDGVVTQTGYHGAEQHVLPSYLTWDLNTVVCLSRMRFFPRQYVDDRWARGHPYRFEIWGSLAYNPNGDLDDSWIPLGSFISEKPSGPGPVTPEDVAAANNGLEFTFDISDFALNPQAPVRYIRFVTRETYAFRPVSTVSISEIDFWGIYVK